MASELAGNSEATLYRQRVQIGEIEMTKYSTEVFMLAAILFIIWLILQIFGLGTL